MGTVTGRVTDHSGRGVPGVWIYAYPAEGGARFGRSVGMHTDLTGRYSLRLPAGTWLVRETGHAAHEVTVGDTPVTTEPQRTTPPAAPAPRARYGQAPRRRGTSLTDLAPPAPEAATREDLQQRLARRRARRTGTEEK